MMLQTTYRLPPFVISKGRGIKLGAKKRPATLFYATQVCRRYRATTRSHSVDHFESSCTSDSRSKKEENMQLKDAHKEVKEKSLLLAVARTSRRSEQR